MRPGTRQEKPDRPGPDPIGPSKAAFKAVVDEKQGEGLTSHNWQNTSQSVRRDDRRMDQTGDHNYVKGAEYVGSQNITQGDVIFVLRVAIMEEASSLKEFPTAMRV